MISLRWKTNEPLYSRASGTTAAEHETPRALPASGSYRLSFARRAAMGTRSPFLVLSSPARELPIPAALRRDLRARSQVHGEGLTPPPELHGDRRLSLALRPQG